MSVYSGLNIKKLVKNKKIKIEPYNEELVQNNSYQLTLLESLKMKKFEFKCVWTKEKITLPNDIVGLMTAKSKLARLGLFFPNSMGCDAGFSGNLVVELFYLGEEEIKLNAGEPILHLWLLKTIGKCKPYRGIYYNQKPGDKL
ncbi:MAG: hypothetical protein AB1779_06825 [Candidatus Thermoplasmatota archaeon]